MKRRDGIYLARKKSDKSYRMDRMGPAVVVGNAVCTVLNPIALTSPVVIMLLV
jgi:hypothetical protein